MQDDDETELREAQRSLLRDAAAVVRRRYARNAGGDRSLPPALAEGLANFFEGVSRCEAPSHDVDRDEAIALAHRLIDDDHPERSRLWPA
ncbi:hypothetical protein [Saccharopolyspora griseoalba]|uniref:Uncharacterized protein n=1 Tax=Saccharopolyspora griseoalba TaxID=1431848 RepID=A0ABW2LR89_9PSEU